MSHPTSSSRPSWLVPLGCLLGTGALIGISTGLVKLAVGAGLSPLSFLTWSVAGAAAVLGGIAGLRGRRVPLTRPLVEYFVVAGLVSLAAPNLLLYLSIPHVGAGFAALALCFPPALTYAGALALGMERYRAARMLGVLSALGGAVWLAAHKLGEPGVAGVWVVAPLASAALLAVGNLYRTARWPEGARPSDLAPGTLAASVVLLLVAGGVAALSPGTGAALSLAVPLDRPLPVALIGVAVATYSVQYALFFVLQREGGPVYLSLLGSVAAVVGVPFAVAVLGEAVPSGLVVAGGLVALGVVLLTRGVASADSPTAAEPDPAARPLSADVRFRRLMGPWAFAAFAALAESGIK